MTSSGSPCAELLALVHHEQRVRHGHDRLHHVLDDEDRHALVAQRRDQVERRLGSRPGRRPAITSSSSSSRGPHRQRLGQLEPAGVGHRQVARRRVRPCRAGPRARAPRRRASIASRADPRRSGPNMPPIATFSRTVRLRNGLTIWNVRATRALAIVHGFSPVMSSPSTNTWPSLGFTWPVIRLISVLLPAPFGPDHAQHRALLDGEREVGHGLDAAEAAGQPPGLEHRAHKR